MLSFWANVTEKDIVNYARGLILQDYMSHLAMDPFHFADQPYNKNGKESLLVSYSGEGRLEEVELDPGQHAKAILASLRPGIVPARVEIPGDAVWSWSFQNTMHAGNRVNRTISGTDNGVATAPSSIPEPVMRIYFNPNPELLGEEAATPFPARQAYVSVSRGELFFSLDVLRDYLECRCRAVLADSMNVLPSDSEMKFEPIAGGYRFLYGPVGGELLLAPDDVLDDLILYARLQRSIGYLANITPIDWHNRPVEITATGVLIRFE